MSELFPDLVAASARDAAKLERERAKLEQRLREHEADFTGREIARHSLAAGWLAPGEHPPPRTAGSRYVLDLADNPNEIRILDIGAGAGVWSSEVLRLARALGVKVHVTAVELRPEEEPWLRRNAHEVLIGHWRTAFAGGRTYDVILGNPPFSEARAATRAEWPENPPKGSMPEVERKAIVARNAPTRRRLIEARLAELARDGLDPTDPDVQMLAAALAEYDPHESMVAVALRHAPAVFLYLTQQGWTKTASGWLTRLHYPPAATYDVPGSISHREGRAADSVSYASSLWLPGHTGAAATQMLRPFAARSWKVRPGTEPDSYYDEHGIPLLVRGVA